MNHPAIHPNGPTRPTRPTRTLRTLRTRSPLAVLAALLIGAALPAGAQVAGAAAAAVPTSASSYEAAREAYDVGHFDSAFTQFAALADAGHCDAARIAVQMLRHGRALYAIEFRASREQVERWERAPNCGRTFAAR